MKNLKNILAMVVLVTVMGVSSSFGGVYYTDKSSVRSDTRPTACDTPIGGGDVGGGIMIGGIMIGGIMIGGIMIGGTGDGGIMIGGDSAVCGQSGSDSGNGGIMIGGVLVGD